MNHECITVKEEAILFAKEKIEDAVEAIAEFLPEASEELGWFREELGKELQSVRSERLALVDNAMFASEGNA